MSVADVKNKYEWIKRLDTACDLVESLLGTGATRVEQLDMGALLMFLDDYQKETVGMIQPELIPAILKPKHRNTILYHVRALKQYLNDFCERVDKGAPVVYHYFPMTPEVFWALGVAPICYEMMAVYCSAFFKEGMAPEIDYTEELGYPHHLCSAQKGAFGGMLKGKTPKPDVLVKNSPPCDPSVMLYQVTAEHYNIPIIAIESPYYSNAEAFEFYVSEWHNMIRELEVLTGNTLDEEELRKHVQWGNEAMRYYYMLEELRKNVPNPDPGLPRIADTASIITLGSNQKYIDYFRVRYQEAAERARRGEGVIPAGKKEIRALWGYAWQSWDLALYDWLEEEFGHTCLHCGLTYFPPDVTGFVDTRSRDSMIRGLAWRAFCFPMARQGMSYADIWINDFVQLAKAYKADCAVFAGHMACKHWWALNKLLSDALMDKAGIPTLRFDTDMFDSRFTPKAEIYGIMSEFFGTFRG
ncbi:MAG: 2-hydroxyacyl-CoA dehydratase family protein [Candidatus Jordarchaeales archaeon]